jgi:diguanylate cyclase (GGDEF)-like protein
MVVILALRITGNLKISHFIVLFGMNIIAIGVSIIDKYFIKSNKKKYCIYTALSILYFWAMFYASYEEAYVSIIATVCAFFFLMFFILDVKAVMIYAISPIAGIIIHSVAHPTPTVKLDNGYYMLVLSAYLAILFLAYKGIKLYKWFELELYEKLALTVSQNKELAAFNEKFKVSQGELFEKYEEVNTLNLNLNEALKKLDAIVKLTEDGLLEINLNENKIHMNDVTKNLFRMNMTDEITLDLIIKHLVQEDRQKFESVYQKLQKGVMDESEIELKYRLDNKIVYYRMAMLKYSENNNDFIIAAIKDITLQKEYELKMYELAYIDSLTGLDKRTSFCNKLDHYLEEDEKNLSLYLIEIQDLSRISSSFGFHVVNDINKYVSDGIKTFFKEAKSVGRIGRSEFAMVFDRSITKETIMQTLRTKMNAFEGEDCFLNIGYKVGAVYCEDKQTATELLHKAEVATYYTKLEIARDISIYKSEYHEGIEHTTKISNELTKAISNHEIYLNFQPKYNTVTKKIMGFETLVRWESKVLGTVPPLEFITIAEHTGYIIELGYYIFEEACKFTKKVVEKDKDIIVSINISGIQLLENNFEKNILALIDKYEVPRKNIGIEITETSIIEKIDIANSVLESLQQKGLKIYLDDFGTGYSSLNYLAGLSIDILKIDKSFIDYIADDERKLALVINILKIAKDLKLNVIAEGVETQDQYLLLKEYGCDAIQGYYFDKPLSEEMALERLKNE